jgi:aspartate-semialdehyde dehydrogenase
VNSDFKSAGIVHAEPARGFFRVAVVGAGTLRGKEVVEVLEQRNFPSLDVKLLDDDESLGQSRCDDHFHSERSRRQSDQVDFYVLASDASPLAGIGSRCGNRQGSSIFRIH